MLIPGLDPRVLLPSTPRSYAQFRVWLSVDAQRPVELPPFTGKVSKSLLILGDPGLVGVISSRVAPKPIHVTPLGLVSSGRVRFLWRRPGTPRIRLKPGMPTFFEVGVSEDLEPRIADAVSGIDGGMLFGAKWRVEGVELARTWLPLEEGLLKNCSHVVVEFRTPANLLDPYKKSRYRRFLPLPGVVFAYNAGELIRMERRGEEYWRVLDLLNAALTEAHTVWDTVSRIYYIYDGKTIPGIYGRAKYFLHTELLEKHEWLDILVSSILVHSTIMGIGTGRATGFGHVTIKTTNKNEEKELAPLASPIST